MVIKSIKIKGPKKPLYLNANLLLSECLNIIQKPYWKISIKTGGTLLKLKTKGYDLLCSSFTKAEVLQRLRLEKSVSLVDARRVFQKVLRDNSIYFLVNIPEVVSLSSDFFDTFSKYNLSFQDYLHIMICKNYAIPMCTHDKKLIKYCKHEVKKKLYEYVYKPEELL